MTDTGGIAEAQLRSYIERIEHLEEEKVALAADIREVYSEAKATGFEPKIMRQIVKERKLDVADRAEQEVLLDMYRRALGMLANTPLGDSAMKRAIDGLGTPVPVSEEDKEKGYVASFEKDGTRMSIGVPVNEAAE